jgi:uncharacterized protein (TIGR03437 family)
MSNSVAVIRPRGARGRPNRYFQVANIAMLAAVITETVIHLSQTVNPVTVTIGSVTSIMNFAGLSPGYPDLYQINAVVPAGVTPGDQVPVAVSIAGQTSPIVTMSVQ